MRTRFLHVANGTSTTRTIEAAGLPGIRSIWADPLFEGPVPALSDAELLEVRMRFLAGAQAPSREPGREAIRLSIPRTTCANGGLPSPVMNPTTS